MRTSYTPRGVCSREMEVEVADGIVTHVAIQGGCSGNIQGLCRLVQGMRAEDAIAKIKGIRCGAKSTSCPDQLSRALEKCLAETAEIAQN